jgi:hypothetical protein
VLVPSPTLLEGELVDIALLLLAPTIPTLSVDGADEIGAHAVPLCKISTLEPFLENVYVALPIVIAAAVLSGIVADVVCEPDAMMIKPLGACARLWVVAELDCAGTGVHVEPL